MPTARTANGAGTCCIRIEATGHLRHQETESAHVAKLFPTGSKYCFQLTTLLISKAKSTLSLVRNLPVVTFGWSKSRKRPSSDRMWRSRGVKGFLHLFDGGGGGSPDTWLLGGQYFCRDIFKSAKLPLCYRGWSNRHSAGKVTIGWKQENYEKNKNCSQVVGYK